MAGADVEEVFETPDSDSDGLDAYTSNFNPPANSSVQAVSDVVTESILPTKAFEVFAGKVFMNMGGTSDRLSRKHLAKRPLIVEEHSGGGGGIESPAERLQRLRDEVNALEEDLQEMAKCTAVDAETPDPWGDMAKEARGLRNDLDRVAGTKTFQPFLGGDFTSTSSSVMTSARLLEELETLKTLASKETATTGVTYDVFYNGSTLSDKTLDSRLIPDASDGTSDTRLLDLDSRLASLEHVIGGNMARDCSSKGLLSFLTSLEARISRMDSSTLSGLQSQAVSTRAELDKLNKRKQALNLGPGDIPAQVDAAYEAIQQWGSVANELPVLIERLVTLQRLHEESATLQGRVSGLEQSQTSTSTIIKSASAQLDTVAKSLSENLKTVHENFAAIGTRIETLTKVT